MVVVASFQCGPTKGKGSRKPRTAYALLSLSGILFFVLSVISLSVCLSSNLRFVLYYSVLIMTNLTAFVSLCRLISPSPKPSCLSIPKDISVRLSASLFLSFSLSLSLSHSHSLRNDEKLQEALTRNRLRLNLYRDAQTDI